MLLGIGIDILHITRLEGMIARRGAARLAQRICSARELADFSALRDTDPDTLARKQLRFLSARWAAKEAAFKALPARTLSGWKDVQLTYARSGRPALQLVWESQRMLAARAEARRRAGIQRGVTADGGNRTDVNTEPGDERGGGGAQACISLLPSLSHDAGVLVAAVVAQRE